MSHNSYVRNLGIWDANKVVSHNEFALLDRGQFVSINGDDGGTWAPLSPIVIGGAGVTLELVGVSSVNDTATVIFRGGSTLDLLTGSLASFSGDMEFAAGSYAHIENGGWIRWRQGSQLEVDTGAFVYLNGTVSVGSTGSFGCQAPAVFSGTVSEFTGTALFTALCQFASSTTVLLQGTTHVSGSADFSGPLTIAGATSLTNKVTASGAGRVVKRTVYIASTGSNNSTYGPSNADRVWVHALSSEVTFTINDAGAVDNDEIQFINSSSAHVLNVNDPGNGLVGAIKAGDPGYASVMTFVRIAGEWKGMPFGA